MTDTQPLHRLLQEQDVGIRKTEDEINALLAFKADYQALTNKLIDFPKTVSRPAILPFGRKALVPGHLIHTNELLVHLGGSDEYFAELSVHETIELIKRRIERLDLSVEKLKQQRRLIHDRVQYTSQFAHQAPHVLTQPPSNDQELTQLQACEEVEIRESYDSDAERDWKTKHKSARQREREALDKMKDPVLKRRVHFATGTKKVDEQAECSSGSATSSADDDSPVPESFIYFQHSATPSLVPRKDISDRSTMTVAEAVNLVVEEGSLVPSVPTVSKPIAAFSDIVERDVTTCTGDYEVPKLDTPALTQPKRVSKFRAERQRQK